MLGLRSVRTQQRARESALNSARCAEACLSKPALGVGSSAHACAMRGGHVPNFGRTTSTTRSFQTRCCCQPLVSSHVANPDRALSEQGPL